MITNQSKPQNLRMTVYCALFTALIIIGAYISIPIPIGPVPITLADFFVMLTGFFLGAKYGFLTVVLYLALGTIGLPVFSNGGSGFAFLFGPTGGFLFGYLFLVVGIGLFIDNLKSSFIIDLLALLVGNVLLYAVGITWLRVTLDMTWSAAVLAGLIPFIPGTIVKIIVALAIGRMFVPRFRENMVRYR